MSLGDCSERNPLVRDGAAQNRRSASALHPRHARLDERGLADLLLFTGRYAAELQYWNGTDAPDGDFAEFVRSDPSYLIAEIAAHRTEGFHDCWRWARDAIEDPGSATIGSDRAIDLALNLLLNEMVTLNRWLRTAGVGLAVRDELERQISGSLRAPLSVALSVHRWLSDESLFPTIPPGDEAQCADKERGSDAWRDAELEGTWYGADGMDTRIVDAIAAADTSGIAIDDSLPVDEKRRLAAVELDPAYEVLSSSLAQLTDTAPQWLHESLSEKHDHAPQMALWLAFAKIFRYAQSRLNQNARRHLDFYFERVLQLERRGAIGDRVHLLFTLAKHVKAHLLEAGTKLPGGKDPDGKNLTYRLTTDAALNAATLAEPGDLKTVFFDRDHDHRPYAAPVAGSADGRGGEFADGAEPKWRPFGESQRVDSGFRAQADQSMAFADIGFAVSSPELLLQEGKRTITLQLFPTIEQSGGGLLPEQVRVRWTGEQGWEEVLAEDIGVVAPTRLVPTTNENEHYLSLEIALRPEDPPVVPFDGEVHGDGYDSPYPIVELRLANDATVDPHGYAALRDVELTAARLNVEVVGARALVVQSDAGVLDPAKPFQPFGPAPVKGNSLYIGSDEAFRKQLQSLKLHWQWQSPPGELLESHYTGYAGSFTNDSFRADWELLAGRKWQGDEDPIALFKDDARDPIDTSLDISALDLPDDRAERWENSTLQDYRATSDWGFVRLRLDGDPAASRDPFGHAQFPQIYAAVALQYAKSGSGDPGLPKPPWTPEIETLWIDYESEVEDILIEPATDSFLHIYPFGQRPTAPSDGVTPLLPRFTHDAASIDSQSTGELYLGLSDLAPRQNLSLLVQVAEGSADPETPQPDVKWWYWRSDGWTRFTSQQLLRDDTGGFIRSGLVLLDIPAEAESDPGLLPGKRHWLRVTVNGDPRGVCDVLQIRAQAAEAVLVDPEQHADHLALPLPAKTIGKLAKKRSAVKSVEQPFASYAGRRPEHASGFHTRVSERLRHKDRAVAMWDYERLVLEQFPTLYKVKCINHSTYVYEDDDFSISQSEFAPGWATVVVIPDLRNQNMVDPLEPRASLATLDDIKAFLAGRVSPWAAKRLRVLNPLYERISVDCKVAFVEGADFAIHRARLVDDLTRYLSPWAFPNAGGADVSFGGRLHRSTLLHFVEKRSYVDFVSDFQMMHTPGDGSAESVERAAPTSARSVFASAATHTIREAPC